MTEPTQLHDALHRRADRLPDGHPLTLDDVRDRAGRLRRRRRVVGGLAAAAVLAVTVPAGLALDDRAPRTPSDPSRVASAPPSSAAGDLRGLLTTDVDARSAEPGVPYLYDGAVRLPGGRSVPVRGEYAHLAALGDGWAATDPAAQRVDFLDATGAVVGSDASTGSLAASPDGTVVAYATPDGAVMAVGADHTPVLLHQARAGAALSVVAVRGEDCAAGECPVWFNDVGPDSRAYVTGPDGSARALRFLRVTGVAPDGSVAGVLTVDDTAPGSCSAVDDPGGEELWRTCDHTLGGFSPGGQHLLGRPAYLDGAGDTSLAILDARTGQVEARWRNDARTQAHLAAPTWDLDGTVLATVFQQGGWSLMRMSPDGALTTVLALDGGDESSPPLRLPTRP